MASLIAQHLRDTPETGIASRRTPTRSHLWSGISCILVAVLAYKPIGALIHLSLSDERYTHILLIPFVTLALIWLKRNVIFAESGRCLSIGLPLLLAGIGTLVINAAFLGGSLAGAIFAVVLLWTGCFLSCYGAQAAKRALFPLLFLLLTIPIPSGLLDKIVFSLQAASAELAYRIFRLTRVPVFREDLFTLALPGVTIQVARECSGIRSSLSLAISSLLVGYLLLRSAWGRVLLVLLTIPIAIFKNAVRIVTISSLGIYVDPGFLHGNLHRYGGLPFSLLAITMIIPILLLLHKAERGSRNRKDPRCE